MNSTYNREEINFWQFNHVKKKSTHKKKPNYFEQIVN